MDLQSERIQADLRGVIRGEVRCDDVFTQLYASDASIYEIRPLAVIRPQNTADVAAVCRYATEHVLPIHARGAGTGLAGESVGPGLVVDFSHGMRRIVGVDAEHVTVQPGVVLGPLNRFLAARGRVFGPDPATGGVTTMGSVLALNTSGSQWLRYGSARDHVVNLQITLADGTEMEAGWHKVTDDPAVDPHPQRRQLVRRLAELLEREAGTIRAFQPQSLVNRCGYHLDGILKDGMVDLAGLITGSEGTLALITQAKLRHEPIPPHRGMLLLFFERLELAAVAAAEIATLGVAACDLVDRRILSIACDSDPHYASILPRAAEAMLVVEQHADTARAVVDLLHQVALKIHVRDKLAFSFHLALEADDFDRFRRIARRVVPLLYRLRGNERPTPFVEDIAVPPARLGEFITRMQKVLHTHDVTASVFGHAGHGQLHVRPLLDMSDPEQVRKMQPLATALYEEVLAVKGTISGEHGAGLVRTWFMQQQFGPLYEVFKEVKQIFDPLNILNPGKVVTEVPQPLIKNLRPAHSIQPVRSGNTETVSNSATPEAHDPRRFELHLLWQNTSPENASELCNGCGRCRTQSPEMRMCPLYRSYPGEEGSPRAKANLMRGALNHRLSQKDLTGNELKAIADLCVNCHQCRVECPAGVDIPRLVIETKAQHVATNGLSSADWMLSRMDSWLDWLAPFSTIVNFGIQSRWVRWLLEQTLGIAQGRKLPRLARRTFLRRAARRRLTRLPFYSSQRVLYFVDIYANWFDVALAEATVAVFEHNGYSVYVPPEQSQSWMTAITLGDVERVRNVVQRNITMLAEAVRDGYEIITTEPSATLAIKHEYLNLVDDEDSRLVAAHTHDAMSFLWKLHGEGKLDTRLRPTAATIGYHLPCHLRVLDDSSPGENLLRLIPELKVERVERGCSGMAGIYGLKRENFRTSVRSGFGLIRGIREPRLVAGATECSTCKLQMEQGTSKATIHPLKILAGAYGLGTAPSELFAARNQELTVT